jgi:hypothetical protein
VLTDQQTAISIDFSLNKKTKESQLCSMMEEAQSPTLAENLL